MPKVGRSTGRQFTKNGVSLPEDGEVSTTHGKFEAKGGLILFTDLDSTNGTLFNGEALVANEAVEVSAGDVLLVGQTELHVVALEAL